MYRLKIPHWKTITSDMQEMRQPLEDGTCIDAGYHYEEFTSSKLDYGIWECPGTPAMRQMWSFFYRAVKIHGVIFVVDSYNQKEDDINLAKYYLHLLMNEDELRSAAFIVVINSRSSKPYDEGNDELQYKLGLHELHKSCKDRVKLVVLDVARVKEHDKAWHTCLDHARTVITRSGVKL